MVRILCVDDDPMILRFLAERLALEPDLRVTGQVGSAASACSHLRREEVDVVLLDHQMEGADGLQLLQTIALWYEDLPPGRERPRVLFFTGYADEAFETLARSLGADGVVAKGCSSVELIPALRAVAGGGAWFDHGRSRTGRGSRRSRTVMVAAQDRMVRTQVAEAILHTHCSVAHAWRSEEVLELLDRELPDALVLEDRLQGRLLCTELLEQAALRWPRLPVIFLAALPPGMEQYRPGANVQVVLSKPLSLSRLDDAIARAVDRQVTVAQFR